MRRVIEHHRVLGILGWPTLMVRLMLAHLTLEREHRVGFLLIRFHQYASHVGRTCARIRRLRWNVPAWDANLHLRRLQS